MNKTKILALKEFKQLFFSPIGFTSLLFSSLFLNIALLYFVGFFKMTEADFTPYFGLYPTLFILLVPIMNLKLYWDDKRFTTDEIILTLPYSEWEIVFARFCAIFFLYVLIFLSTVFMPLTLLVWGDFDIGVLITSLAGVFLNGTASIALCIFVTVLNRGTITAWFYSIILLIILNGSYLNSGFLSLFTFSGHMESFSRGLLVPGDILFFIIAVFFFLYTSSRVLFIRRWK